MPKLPDELTIPLAPNVPLELILVRPGYFIMGSEAEEAYERESPEHIVHITEPYYIGKYPVTQAQWEVVMGSNPSFFPNPQRPVERVSWLDIVKGNQEDKRNPAFLDQINLLLSKTRPQLALGHHFRLPTEAEWEYAAKGGPRFGLETLRGKKAAQLYPLYAGSDQLEPCGWFGDNSKGETKPVGLKQANELGLYDMSGNVLEWCYDGIAHYANRKTEVIKNPVGPVGGDSRVVRGGRYFRYDECCRSVYRMHSGPAYRSDSFGFRLVLSPSSGPGISG